MSSILYDSHNVAEARCLGVHLLRGAGIYQLRVSINFSITPWIGKTFRFESPRLKITMLPNNAGILIGYAHPEIPILIRTFDHPHSFSCLFEKELLPSQLEAIENRRGGSDICFKFDLQGEVYGPGEPSVGTTELHFTVARSDWIVQLNAVQFDSILLLEIPMPVLEEDRPLLKNACLHLSRSRALFLAGHYNEAIAKCRLAIEAVEEVDRLGAASNLGPTSKRDMNITERFDAMRAAAKHVTQLALHDLSLEQASDYSRADAVAIIGITAAILGRAGQASYFE